MGKGSVIRLNPSNCSASADRRKQVSQLQITGIQFLPIWSDKVFVYFGVWHVFSMSSRQILNLPFISLIIIKFPVLKVL